MGSTKTVDVLAFSFRDLAALRQADPSNTRMFTRLGFGKLDEDEREARHYEYIMALDGAKAVGMVAMYHSGVRGQILKAIGVDPKHQRAGIGRQLVSSAFDYVAVRGHTLEPSRFSPTGQVVLGRVIPEMHHRQYPQVPVLWDSGHAIQGHKAYKLMYDERDGSRYPVMLPP